MKYSAYTDNLTPLSNYNGLTALVKPCHQHHTRRQFPIQTHLQAQIQENPVNNICRMPSDYAIFTATGFPRPIENPLVPSGIRGPGGCLATVGSSLLHILLEGGVPTWFPRLPWWCWPRPRPLPRPRLRPLLCPPSFSLTCSSPYTKEEKKIIICEKGGRGEEMCRPYYWLKYLNVMSWTIR